MTIALGILATDGIVLAADSEITVGPDLKGNDTKIVAVTSKSYQGIDVSAAMAGVGSLTYFQSLRGDVARTVAEALKSDNNSDVHVKGTLEDFLCRFHERHVIPFAQFQEPPEVKLLVATSIAGKYQLWATDKSTVRDCPFGFEALGVGGIYAYNLLNAYWCPMSVEVAAILAAYVVYRVKATIANCGQDTHMLILQGGRVHWLNRKIMMNCSLAFEAYNEMHLEAFKVVTSLSPEADELQKNLQRTRDAYTKILQDIAAIISLNSQT